MYNLIADQPEVNAVYTTAGTQDVIAQLRATDLGHLRDIIHRLRATPGLLGTRTHVIFDTPPP